MRDITAQYRQTALGYAWAVLPALMLTLVWAILNSSSILNVNTNSALPYAVFALTGTIFWQLFIDALNAPLSQLSGNRTMLVRVRFPPEALLFSGLVQVAFSFVIKLALLGVVLAAYETPIRWTAIFIPMPALAIAALGTVVGGLLTPLGALYKDIQQGLTAVVMPLLFVTPVFYPPPAAGPLAKIMKFNPLTPLFEATRALLYGGPIAPHVASFAAVFGASIALAFLGWLLLRLVMPLLIERMEA